ncbi:MAG TPA: SDR family NAD(P)-dependent oxidoreductase [Terriglobales bacterium]|nr:SDR family NAD(P)-dependent oxidoreductase [Terriglobales bacterium]
MLTISLDGQVAAVSGGSRGIGAATVRLLAEAGAQVVFSYQANRAAAEAVVAAGGGPARVAALAADARAAESGERLVRAAVERFGRLDIAVANAGIWNAGDIAIEDLSPEAWDETIEINLRGVYSLARAAVRQMKQQARSGAAAGKGPRGRIIAIASTAGQRGEAWHTHYGASKAGVIGLVRGLATEVARDGILVNCVAPGWIETDMSRPAFGTHPERVFAAIPLGQPGQPEEIAGCVAFLCSPWANFLCGSILSANGGAVLA